MAPKQHQQDAIPPCCRHHPSPAPPLPRQRGTQPWPPPPRPWAPPPLASRLPTSFSNSGALSRQQQQQQAPSPYLGAAAAFPHLPASLPHAEQAPSSSSSMAPLLLASSSPAQHLSRSCNSKDAVRHSSFSHHRRVAAAPRRWPLLPFPKAAAAASLGVTTPAPFCH
ncbi:hypothetical protein U9M48_000771 [Paspalum notatum var. saurae]|uniref:Uncharacterized protein n=1 Tax=Paspalum notatum var. saurae TaxID=547442 RepID=A0AAQ3PHE2_PASNO